MTKPIEERVRDIVDNSLSLNIRDKYTIVGLIECYKGADYTAQDYGKRIEKANNYIKTIERRGNVDIKDIWWLKHLLSNSN